nr:uncharacterized protein LOC109764589 [Aegilops tauschii subsp. strangulata]
MDARAGTPLTPSYSRNPSTAAAANPSAGSVGLASAGAPPSIGLARGLFMPPRMTSAAGGVAPAPPHSLFALFYIFCSLNDDAYMSTMGVGSNNSHWSQTNYMHFDDREFEVDEDGEGIVDAPKGRAGNYTNAEDILLCNTWLQVSRDPSVGGDQSRDAYWNRMKEHFDVRNVSGIDHFERSLRSRWSTINKDCQKWAAAQKAVDKLNPSGTNEDDRRTIELDDNDEEEDASSDDGKRSPTPNSVSYSKPKRPDGCKKDAKEKKKRKGDDELKNAMEAIVKARKEANEVRKMARNQDAAAEERRLAAEERRVAAEERRVAAEERKVPLEERKVSNEERTRLLEWALVLLGHIYPQ